jgi:TolB-like protein
MSPSADEVRRQLDRLLASAVFANAGRMSRFLRFVVDQTLAGEGERLKEYVIGVEVFDRDATYDPRLDSIVRVEAARLRSKLAEYYAGEGRSDALVLSLPKGGYAPIVTLEPRSGAGNGAAATNATAAAVPAAQPEQPRPLSHSARRRWALAAVLAAGAATAAVLAWAPGVTSLRELRVAVLPFSSGAADAAGEALALELTEGVTAELVRAGRFGVVASSAARAEYSASRRPRELAAALDADVLVGARVRADGERVRVETYAVGGELEEKLWVDGFDGAVADTDSLERAIGAAIVDALGKAELAAGR